MDSINVASSINLDSNHESQKLVKRTSSVNTLIASPRVIVSKGGVLTNSQDIGGIRSKRRILETNQDSGGSGSKKKIPQPNPNSGATGSKRRIFIENGQCDTDSKKNSLQDFQMSIRSFRKGSVFIQGDL